jgi:hypothetical protein
MEFRNLLTLVFLCGRLLNLFFLRSFAAIKICGLNVLAGMDGEWNDQRLFPAGWRRFEVDQHFDS